MMRAVVFLSAASAFALTAAICVAQSDPKLPFPQNRVRDFYFRQAEQFLDQRPSDRAGVLPQFPGLDGGGFGHWGQNPEEVSFDYSVNDADTGNVVCQISHHFGKTTPKGVNVLLHPTSRTSVLFDPQRMTFVDSWTGGFVKWGFVRFGLMEGVQADGRQLVDFDSSEWVLPGGTPSVYRGFYRYGQHVAFASSIGTSHVLDSCIAEDGQLVRTLQIDGRLPAATFLKLIAPSAGAGISRTTTPVGSFLIAGRDQSVRVGLSESVSGATLDVVDGAIGILFDGSPVTSPVQIQLAAFVGTSKVPPVLAKSIAVPSATDVMTGANDHVSHVAPVICETTGVVAASAGPLAIDSITLPHGQSNPYKSAMRIGGVGCLSDGRVVVSTLMGEVWLVDGIDGMASGKPLRWQRIAAGLYQALGIVIRDDSILVLGSDQITRLMDLNGDSTTDFYECHTNAYPTTGGHDFCTSLQQDDPGRLYWSVSSGDTGVVRMGSDGVIESLGHGLRNSNGIGVSRDGSVVLATVQEGTWTPASAIFEVSAKSYHGLNGPKEGHGRYGYDLPLCFVPRGIDNSSGEIGFLPKDDRLGSLSGAAVGTSFGTCHAYVVLRDVVNGKSQGAIVPLPGEFLSGSCRVAFNNHDGCVYIAGTEGWQSYAREDGCLHRVRLTGNPFPLPTAIEAHSNGVVIRFNEAIDPQSVSLENTFCQQWNYLYSAGYGSPEYSVRDPGRQAHDVVDVKSVRLMPDHRSVFIEVPQMHPVMQFHVHMRLKTSAGHSFVPDMYASIFELRPDLTDFPGYAPIVKRRAPEFPIAEKYEQDPRLVQQESFGTDFGWVSSSLKISVSASPGLQFEPRQLRVPPGSRVSLAFRNGDPGMPHNVAIVRADDVDSFGEQSMQLASNPRAIATHYVPEAPAEICFSPILPPGDQYTMYFEAPKEPAEYRLVCTYPGHWRVMQGSLFVIPDGEPLPESTLAPSRKFVHLWTTGDLATEAETLAARSFIQGRTTFEAAGCSKCHRMNNTGTALGPELTKVSERFKGQKIVQQLLEPSTEINKQYQTWVAALNDGRVIAGLMTEQTDSSITLLPNPLKPEAKITLQRADIEELEPSMTSTMPTSLLITFTRDEILDLVAFLQSGGDESHELFTR